MTDFVHIEPSDGQRRAFARWALSQTPKLQTSSSTGTDVPVDLYPSVPPELLEGAYVDGYLYGGTAAPQPPAARPPKDEAPPRSKPAQKAPQAAAERPEPSPRKRAPRRPRKTAATKLKAEQLAAETVRDIAAASGEDSPSE